MTKTVYIKVENLTQSFGSQDVLKGVNFDVYRGELLVLIGGSGAGKSVILKHIAGLMDPIKGSVLVNGELMSNVSEKEKRPLRAQMGFMFQQGALFDSMNVFENVAFPLTEKGMGRREIETRVQDALDSLGLSTHGDKMPANLSGGMIKRVAVARAMVTEPECLLYDEPTAGLDPIVTDSVSYMMRRICVQQGITTIVVSHDMESVMNIADRIIYLREGQIYWQGTPQEMIDSEDPTIQNFLNGSSGEDWSSLDAVPRAQFKASPHRTLSQ